MNKTIKFLTMLLLLAVSVGAWADETTIEYQFTSKGWASQTEVNGPNVQWISGKDGAGFSNGGIQVTTTATGANGTCPNSYDNISKIVVTYNTNKSKGAGSIVAKIGNNDAKTNSVAYSGSVDGTTANFTTEFTYDTPQTGTLKLTVNTTTNSIYLCKVAITYNPSSSSAVATTTTIDASDITNTDVNTSTTAGSLSATVSAGGNAISGATVSWSSSNTSVATIDENGAITLVAAGTTTIMASYAGVTDKYQASYATYDLTVTSSAPVIDYATLPFDWEGGAKADFLALNGVTANGLGSDYAAANAPYLIKLDGTGDYIQVKTDSQPGKVTIGVKMLGGGNTSTITVQGSADGETFTDIQELSISGAQNAVLTLETTNSFAATDRYVRLLFTRGSNVGVGPITIAQYVEPSHDPVITLDPSTINVDAEEHNDGTIAISYNNFGLLDVGDFNIQYYDAENEEITEPDWIVADVEQPQGGDFVVSYSVEANEGAARAAYFKVYAMDGNENLVYSNLVTITQAAAPVAYTSIPALFAAATSTSTPVNVTFGNWVVSGVNGSQLFVTDGTHGFIVYQSEHGFKVGNILSGTASCNLVLFNGSAELTGLTSTTSGLTVETGGSVTPVVTTIDALGAVNTGSVVTLSNLTYDGTNLSDGTNTIIPWTTLYNGTFDNGKTYNVTGVFVLNNNDKRILPRSAADIEEVLIPVITVTPSTVNVDAAGGEDTLPISFENLDITGITDFVIQYCDAQGQELEEDPDWITNIEVREDQNDNYVVNYSIAANEGEARTAYFKVIAVGAPYLRAP